MKKVIIALAMCVAGFSAFADDNTANSGSSSTAVTSSSSDAAAAVKNSGNASQGQDQGQQQGQQQKSVAVTGAATSSNAQSVTFTSPSDTTAHVVYSGTQTLRNVPSVNGPNLTSSNDTCMGSASGSANGPGFGISLGKTYTDTNCVRLKNARELWNMGMKAASLALLCKDDENREALELTGFHCPQAGKATTAQVSAADENQYTGNDPIVRARLGLPPVDVASK